MFRWRILNVSSKTVPNCEATKYEEKSRTMHNLRYGNVKHKLLRFWKTRWNRLEPFIFTRILHKIQTNKIYIFKIKAMLTSFWSTRRPHKHHSVSNLDHIKKFKIFQIRSNLVIPSRSSSLSGNAKPVHLKKPYSLIKSIQKFGVISHMH